MSLKPTISYTFAALMSAAVLLTSACGNTVHNVSPRTQSVKPSVQARSYIEKLPVTDASGLTWLPLEPAARSLGYRIEDEPGGGGYVKIGYSDVMYRVRPDSKTAFSLGHTLTLPDAPALKNGKLYMTTAALSALFHTKVSVNPDNHEIVLDTPRKEPNDSPSAGSGTIRIQSLSAADAADLVAYAKRFLGVPYEFGAAPYEESKTFDCSSFTRHVFKKYGVSLPRLAKDQDNVGRSVTREQLQTGDLIFFSVPGRFEQDSIPGHVGIYIGNGKFIHTWGDPGVQISDLDNGYWHGVTLGMRRVL